MIVQTIEARVPIARGETLEWVEALNVTDF